MTHSHARKLVWLRSPGAAGLLSFLALTLTSAAPGQTNVSGPIPDSTWDVSGSPYRIIGDAWITGGNLLTIEPGVQVAFVGDYRLSVGKFQGGADAGTLVAQGTQGSPILIYAENPGGYWVQIEFTEYASPASVLSDAVLSDGKNASPGGFGAIHCRGSSPSLSNLTLQNCESAGIYLQKSGGQIGASPTFSGTLSLTGNSTGYLIQASGSESTATFSNCTVSSVGGLAQAGTDFWTEFFDGGTTIDAGSVGRTAVVMSSPGLDRTTTWGAPNLDAIHLESDLTIKGNPMPVLTLTPGTVVTMAMSVAIKIGTDTEEGALVAVGTAVDRIRFEGPLEDYADGLVFDSMSRDSICRLEMCDLLRCGKDAGTAALECFSASPAIADVTVTESDNTGVRFTDSASEVRDLTISGFGNYGIVFTGSGQAPTLVGTSLVEVGETGLQFTTSFNTTPHLSGLTIQSVAEAVSGTSQAIPTFESITIDLAAGDLGEGEPDLWANLLNNATVSGTGIQRVLSKSTLSKSTTWGGVGFEIHFLGHPTQATAQSVEGLNGPVLTIAPGTTIKLDSKVSLLVGNALPGGIIAAGTATDHVVFEGLGGDLWGMMYIGQNALDGSCNLTYCDFDGGGTSQQAVPTIKSYQSSPTLQHIIVSGHGNLGLELSESGAALSDVEVSGLDPGSTGLKFLNSDAASLTGMANTVNGGQTGVIFDASSPRIESLTIGGTSGFALTATTLAPDSVPSFSGITIEADAGQLGQGVADFWADFLNSGPTVEATANDRTLEVFESNLTQSCTWGVDPMDKVRLVGSVGVYGPLGPVLTVEAGTVVEAATGVKLVVGGLVPAAPFVVASGGLVVQGTVSERVVFQGVSGASWGPVELLDRAIATGLSLSYCDFNDMDEPVVIDGCEPIVVDVGFHFSGDDLGDCALLIKNLTDAHDLLLDTIFVEDPYDWRVPSS